MDRKKLRFSIHDDIIDNLLVLFGRVSARRVDECPAGAKNVQGTAKQLPLEATETSNHLGICA